MQNKDVHLLVVVWLIGMLAIWAMHAGIGLAVSASPGSEQQSGPQIYTRYLEERPTLLDDKGRIRKSGVLHGSDPNCAEIRSVLQDEPARPAVPPEAGYGADNVRDDGQARDSIGVGECRPLRRSGTDGL